MGIYPIQAFFKTNLETKIQGMYTRIDLRNDSVQLSRVALLKSVSPEKEYH